MLVFPKCNHPLTTQKSPPNTPYYLRHVTSASPLAASPPRLRAKAMPCGASKRSHKSWIPWTSSGAWSWHTKITDSQLGQEKENFWHWGFLDDLWMGSFFECFGGRFLEAWSWKKTQEGFWCGVFLLGRKSLQVLNRKMEELLEMREAINPPKKTCVTLKEKAPWYLFKTFLWWLSDPVKG